MSKRNQQLEAVLGELRAAGIASEIRVNKHVQVLWRGPGGVARVCAIAKSSRSATGTANARATARRMLRQDGMLP